MVRPGGVGVRQLGRQPDLPNFIRIELRMENRVLSAVNKLHRSIVETTAAYMLPAPTYDLHVAQFYDSDVR